MEMFARVWGCCRNPTLTLSLCTDHWKGAHSWVLVILQPLPFRSGGQGALTGRGCSRVWQWGWEGLQRRAKMSPHSDAALGAQDTEVTVTVPSWCSPQSVTEHVIVWCQQQSGGCPGCFRRVEQVDAVDWRVREVNQADREEYGQRRQAYYLILF